MNGLSNMSLAKGLNVRSTREMTGQIDRFDPYARHRPKTITGQLRRMEREMDRLYRGTRIRKLSEGRGKNRIAVWLVVEPEGRRWRVAQVSLSRDLGGAEVRNLPFVISEHAAVRMKQGGTSIARELAVFHPESNLKDLPEGGVTALATANGLAQLKRESNGDFLMLTWLRRDTLNPGKEQTYQQITGRAN